MGKSRADRIAKMIRDFTLSEFEDLQFFIDEQIDRLREAEEGGAYIEEEEEQTKTIREEYKRCGKPGCQCNTEGKLHGPYLYEYWKEDGRTRSKYIGKAENRKKKSARSGTRRS